MNYRFEEEKKNRKEKLISFLTRSGPVSVKMSSFELHVNDEKSTESKIKRTRKNMWMEGGIDTRKKYFYRTLNVQDSHRTGPLTVKMSSFELKR